MTNYTPTPETDVRQLADYLQLPRDAPVNSWSYNDRRLLLKQLLFKYLDLVRAASKSSPNAQWFALEQFLMHYPMDKIEEYLQKNFGWALSQEYSRWKNVIEAAMLVKPHEPAEAKAQDPTVAEPQKPSDMKQAEQKATVKSPKVLSVHKNSNTLKLWQHLLSELQSGSENLEWLDRSSGRFRFVKPKPAAAAWGRLKGRLRMDYEKMTHSIRNYYKKTAAATEQQWRMYKGMRHKEYGFNMANLEVAAFLRKVSQ